MRIKTFSFKELFFPISPHLGDGRRKKFLEILNRQILWKILKVLICSHYKEEKSGEKPRAQDVTNWMPFSSGEQYSSRCESCSKRYFRSREPNID